MKMSQDVKILSEVLLNIFLNKIYTGNQSELTLQQYYVMELPTQILQNRKWSVFFVDMESMQPTLELFECLGLDSSQDVTGIFDAMTATFQKHNLSSLLQKLIFLSCWSLSKQWAQVRLFFFSPRRSRMGGVNMVLQSLFRVCSERRLKNVYITSWRITNASLSSVQKLI